MSTLADKWGIQPEHFWLRGREPEHQVRFDEELSLWSVYGYAEALEVFGDQETFSNDTARLFPVDDADTWYTDGDLLRMDPPEHRKLRQLVSHAFTPKLVADLEPRISELTHELLEAVAGRDEFELVAALAHPLPVIVIAELLGVPSSDRDLFKGWADKLIQGTDQYSLTDNSEEQERELQNQLDQLRQMGEYIRGHAVERRQRPREDLLTQLVLAEVDGERLTDNQVLNVSNLLLIAGHITTTMLLGNTVLCLDAHPDQEAWVRGDRSTVPGLIEESLRFLSPVSAVQRATTKEVELAGQRIPRDQMLLVWVAAANRDRRQFDRPDVFNIDRDPNPHLGFGRGIHFCLGAPLARLEGLTALNILLDRYAELRVDPGKPPTFMPTPDFTGVRTLPVCTG